MAVEAVRNRGEELKEWLATVELAVNTSLRRSIRDSREEYEKGKSREWNEARDSF